MIGKQSRKGRGIFKQILYVLYNFFVFFLIVGFVVTCSLMLFLNVMSGSIGLELTDANISVAAKLTFINVLFLSLIFTAVDTVRRRLTVQKPARQIIDAANKMMAGDFSVRIPSTHGLEPESVFAEISDCFNKMAEELSGVETLRSDFIANVSHELKTPLSVIRNYATILQSEELGEEERREYASAVSDAARRLSELVTNILRLSKLENQQSEPIAVEYDLGGQLCECMLGFESAWEKKSIDIQADIEDDVIISADAEMMSLVWNNLLSNAIKFTDEGGRVELTLATEGKYAYVKVKDTGCGISAEEGKHIFDKFYQSDSSRATQGNGLGLALVKRVVDIAGCDITVDSAVGEGSTFTVKIRRVENGHQEVM